MQKEELKIKSVSGKVVFYTKNLSKLFSFRDSSPDPAGGAYSSLPALLVYVEGARCAAPPQEPHPRIGPSGHVTTVPPNFEIRATPLFSMPKSNMASISKTVR